MLKLHQHVVDKVKLIRPIETLPLTLIDQKIYINDEVLKKLTKARGGDDRFVQLAWLTIVIYALILFPDEVGAFLSQIAKVNTPTLTENQHHPGPGQFGSNRISRTVESILLSQSDSNTNDYNS